MLSVGTFGSTVLSLTRCFSDGLVDELQVAWETGARMKLPTLNYLVAAESFQNLQTRGLVDFPVR